MKKTNRDRRNSTPQPQAEAAARTAFLARLPPIHRQIVNIAPGYLWHRVLLAAEDYIRALLSRQAVLAAENHRLREEVGRQRKRIEELERGNEDLDEGKEGGGEGEKAGQTESEPAQEARNVDMKHGE